MGTVLQPATIDQHLGLRIAEARHKSGISRSETALKIDITEHLLTAFETGRVRIPALYLSRIARLLNRPLSWFYGGLPGQSAFDQIQRKVPTSVAQS